jgi:hypothetical protein
MSGHERLPIARRPARAGASVAHGLLALRLFDAATATGMMPPGKGGRITGEP